MFGLPWITTFAFIIVPALELILSGIYMIRGRYEGQDVEETYGVENWYRTWG